MNCKPAANVNRFDIHGNVIHKPEAISILGNNLDVEMDENLMNLSLIREGLDSLKSQMSSPLRVQAKVSIYLADRDAATLRFVRERPLWTLRNLHEIPIDFKVKCEGKQEDAKRLEEYLARLPPDSLGIMTIMRKTEVLEEYCVKTWKADAIIIARIKELNRVVTPLLESAKQKKATQQLYENFERALEGAMRPSYAAENLIEEANE